MFQSKVTPQPTAKGPDQVPRQRRSSLLPIPTSSASYTSKLPPSSSFAVTNSSPSSRGATFNKTITCASATKTLKRMTSTSVLQPSSTIPSVQLKRKAEPSPQQKKIASMVGSSSISEFGILPSRSSLKPSTAANRLATSEILPPKGSSTSGLPRSRIGSLTPTRSALTKQSNLSRVTSNLSIASPKIEQQKAVVVDVSKKKNVATTPPMASVKSRATLWAQMNDSCPSPSPSGKSKSGSQNGIDASKVVPTRTRRMSLVQQTSRVLRPDATRLRRTSFIAAQASGVMGNKVDSAEKNGSDTVEGENIIAILNNDAQEMIDTPLLQDEKVLDQMDAKVGLFDQSISTSRGIESDIVNDSLQSGSLMKLMTEQRDEALNRERQLYKELKAAKERIWMMEKAAESKRQVELQQREKSEMASQTDMIIKKQQHDIKTRHQITREAPLVSIAMENTRDEWRHATQIASNYLASLQSQSEICSNYFGTQLDMFQLSIEETKMIVIQD